MHSHVANVGSLVELPGSFLRLEGTSVRDVSDEACRELRCRREDLLGDGFVRSLVEADREALTDATQALLTSVEPGAIEPGAPGALDRVVPIGVSIGIAIGQPDLSATDLIRSADQAMYEAKAGGKGQFRVA